MGRSIDVSYANIESFALLGIVNGRDNKKGLEKTPKPLISLVAKEYFVFTGSSSRYCSTERCMLLIDRAT